MMKLILVIFLTLSWSIGYSCDCSPTRNLSEAQKLEFENSDHVILGEIIKVSEDQKNLILIVKEIFKGDFIEAQLIEFENNHYCEPFVDKPEEWLIYAMIEDGKFRINICGLSRSINNPERNRYFFTPPPPPAPDSTKNDFEENKIIRTLKEEQRQIAIMETEKEIRKLRNLKE